MKSAAYLLICCGALGCYNPYPESESNPDPVPTKTVALQPSDEDFPNPERGFYAHTGSILEDAFPAQVVATFESGKRLGFVQTNLVDFTSADFGSAELTTIATNLEAARDAGIKLVLRFGYSYQGDPDPSMTLEQVTRHLEQLTPILSEHVDAIAYFQAGLIGQGGNWGSGTLTSSVEKRQVRDLLLTAVPKAIPIQFPQEPVVQELWFPSPLTASAFFDGSVASRVGLHNDCILSSDSDFNYFPGEGASFGADFTTTTTEAEQRAYAAAVTAYTPFGGETCRDTGGPAEAQARMACQGGEDGAGQPGGILNEGPRYHLTFLNQSFTRAFIDQWQEEGCFDEVSRSLGYRFQLDRLTVPETVARGKRARVEVDLRNIGWGRIFSPRPLVITLEKGNARLVGESETLLRSLDPQASSSTTISIEITVPEAAEAGDYAVLVSSPDVYATTRSMRAHAIRFANADRPENSQLWNDERAHFETGATIAVE
jgi:hypothetical protein